MEKILKKKTKEVILTLRDSKKLNANMRKLWYAKILQWQKEGKLEVVATSISADEIDTKGLAPAIKKALATSIKKLKLNPKDCTVLLDGGLHAPVEYVDQTTVIKGDEKHAVIALASIYAKVTRDIYMHKQSKLYPEYGFENHVGYGTSAHYKTIKKSGLTPLHRKSFLKKIIK